MSSERTCEDRLEERGRERERVGSARTGAECMVGSRVWGEGRGAKQQRLKDFLRVMQSGRPFNCR